MVRLKPSYQVTQSDCGIACAHMLLQSVGIRTSLVNMRTEYAAGRDGLDLASIRKILLYFGVTTKVYQCSFSRLERLHLPVIVAWRPSHYVLLLKIDGAACHIIDPAVGRRKVSVEKFKDHFVGYCIVADRSEPIDVGEETRDDNPWMVIGRLLKDAPSAFSPLLVVAALVAIATLYAPNAAARLVESYADSPSTLLWLSLAGLVVGFFLVQTINVVVTALTASRIGRFLSERVLSSLLNAPMAYFLVRPQGELLYRLSLLKTVESFVTNVLPRMVVAGVMLFVSLLAILRVDLLVFLGLGAISVVYLGLSRYSQLKIARVTEEINSEESLANSIMVDSITSIQVVKSLGIEKSSCQQWAKKNRRIFELDRTRTVIAGTVSAFVSSVQSFLPVVAFLIAFWNSEGDIALSSALKVQLFATLYLAQLAILVEASGKTGEANAAVRRINDLVVYKERPIFNADASEDFRLPLTGTSLSYRYGAFGKAVVTGVDIDVSSGSRIALVGRSGSGKSTVAQLLAGLLSPTSGTIQAGQVPIEEIRQTEFFQNVCFVPQDAPLRSATLRDNLCWGEDIPDEDLYTALKLAQFEFDGQDFPMGLDTFLVNGGKNISGGQRQRIAIARCFLRQPEVIILDEATSGLDQYTEAELYRAFQDLDCALVTITHRLEAIQDFDEIIVLDGGSIVEKGNFAELNMFDGVFNMMYKSYRKEKQETV